MRQSTSRRAAAGQQYAIIVGLIGVIAILAVTQLGSGVKSLMANTGNTLTNVVNGTVGSGSSGGGGGGGGGGGPLYAFTSHTFTNCGATHDTPPTLTNCQTAYSSTSWAANPAYFSMPTPGFQTWVVPQSGSYRFTLDGAAGGTFAPTRPYGGRVVGERSLTQGQVLTIVVGQMGERLYPASGSSGPEYYPAGGFNGGGGTGFPDNLCNNCGHASGGGGTDVRLGGTALADRIIVAGGGAGTSSSAAGGSTNYVGGAGGGLTGQNGIGGSNPGNGGTQLAGGIATGTTPGEPGALGQGGRGQRNDGSGGGGGYYGGAGGGNNSAGGGGSSFADGSFSSVVHTQGVRDGHGQVLIERLP